MKCAKRPKKLPHEDSYLTIFNRHSAQFTGEIAKLLLRKSCPSARAQAPRSRRKQAWPDKFPLAAKKRLLACYADRENFQKCSKASRQRSGEEEGDGDLLCLCSACAAAATAQHHLHTKLDLYLTSRLVSRSSADCAEDELTLEDCWPASELTLQWLRQGREKMDAFKGALRQRLSAPVEPCHWPLPVCKKCTTVPLYGRRVPKLGIPPAFSQFTGDQTCGVSGHNRSVVTVGDLNNKNDNSSKGSAYETACLCTYARNCALVISEDPLLRLSLLATSLGVSEVHTVVMKESNWENAATYAKCFGRPDSLKVFPSLEALEEEVFEHRIAQVLTGEVTPAHTCVGAASCECQQRDDAGMGVVPGLSRQHHCQDSHTGTAEPDGTAELLQAHLHRYRIVLIDDQYCGPVVSALGLPLLLEFVRTHTCPACCQVVPRRWQTLATPAACPPPVPSRQYLKLVARQKPDEPQQRQLAASGRAMSDTSIRLEDVALSGRFCVLESFEMASLTRCSYKDLEVQQACGLCTEGFGDSANLPKDRHSSKKDIDGCLDKNKAANASCLRCARDRQLKWSKERQTIVNGNAVCSVEIAGPCAGLIVRSHILVDEGITLSPGAPLMIFLPDEVQLSTRHVVVVAPVVVSERTPALSDPQRSADDSPGKVQGTWPHCCSSILEACESVADGSRLLQKAHCERQECAVSCDSAASTPVSDELHKTKPAIPPWRGLKAQQPKCCWRWTAVCDGIGQSEFDIEVTLRDLYQTTREQGVERVKSPVNSEIA